MTIAAVAFSLFFCLWRWALRVAVLALRAATTNGSSRFGVTMTVLVVSITAVDDETGGNWVVGGYERSRASGKRRAFVRRQWWICPNVQAPPSFWLGSGRRTPTLTDV